MNLDIGYGSEVAVNVVRTDRRKTATIEVVAGDVRVICPRRLSEERIEALVRRKAAWIRQKLRLQAALPPVKPKEYVSGEAFSYLGKNYRLKLTRGARGQVKLVGGRLTLPVPEELTGEARTDYVKNRLARWYREHALQRLRRKADRYAPLLEVSPSSVGVKYFKARWGSCSVRGDITFNWRIIMAPHRIVDYVVVHELAHLRQHNHSSEFWKCVGAVIPEYRECREWLKNHGMGLSL